MQTLFENLGKLTAMLLVLALGISWWLAPGPQAPDPAQSRDESWALPTVAQSHSDRSVTAIGAANLWGLVQKTAAAASLNEPEWRFSGVAINGKDRFVMIAIEGQAMQTLKVGDQLPGGAKILRINNDHLCLLINGKNRKLDIF